MIERVYSGGQRGADQGGWRAAMAVGIPTGGWMTRGFLTERPGGDGLESHPEFAAIYGAKEHASDRFPARTEANARDSDVTIWFGDPMSRGGKCTSLACARHIKHFVVVDEEWTTRKLVFHMEMHEEWRVVNVAGSRESHAPGIGDRVERYLTKVFQLLRV